MNLIADNPFHADNSLAYQQWREQKLGALKHTAQQVIAITNPQSITANEHKQLSMQVACFNMAIFKLPDRFEFSDKILKIFGSQFALNRLDSNLYANESDISELRVSENKRRGEYIPYTNRALGWHTDGYYNQADKTIRAFMLYCVNNAETGGDNQLLDPELAYMHLRDQDTDLIRALMRPDSFTIPATIENGKQVRPQQTNPVFQIDPLSGGLLMRYTQRKTHIQWRTDDATQQALSLLGDLLVSDSAHILNVRLNPGEGLICNNVLHNRTAFTDNPEQPRIILRARYYDRFNNNHA